MFGSPGSCARELTCLVAGASIGGLGRYMIAAAHPAMGATLILVVSAAALIGFASAIPVRQPIRAALLGAGGTAGSVSVAACNAVSETPLQGAVGVLGYLGGAVVGFACGTLTAVAVRHSQERR
jgi:hypothetical protein